jgi:hypothetical protein
VVLLVGGSAGCDVSLQLDVHAGRHCSRAASTGVQLEMAWRSLLFNGVASGVAS